jgi:hypothetical protein
VKSVANNNIIISNIVTSNKDTHKAIQYHFTMLKFQNEPAHEAKPSGAASQLHEQSGKDQRQLSANSKGLLFSEPYFKINIVSTHFKDNIQYIL